MPLGILRKLFAIVQLLLLYVYTYRTVRTGLIPWWIIALISHRFALLPLILLLRTTLVVVPARGFILRKSTATS
ncbi:hypothetical protein ATN79_20305 [Paraburkholderia caribensis]|nr:hypothetical protein ATN79_20305 [Paraburkholderia caribensis]